MSRKSRTQSTIRKKSLPASIVRASVAGEMSNHFGCDEATTRTAQEGFASKAWKAFEIYGTDHNGYARAKVRLNVNQSTGEGHVTIDGDDTRSMTERLEGGYAKAFERTKEYFDKRGLRPEPRFQFDDGIENDPARKRAEQQRLGTVTCDPPPWAPGHKARRVAKLTPGRDRDQWFEIFGSRKKP